MKPVRIALLGCGTVGEGVVRLMRRNAAMFERRLGAPLELAAIADRSLKPIPSLGIGAKLITRDAASLIARPDVDIVAELFGGYEPARGLILQSIAAGSRHIHPLHTLLVSAVAWSRALSESRHGKYRTAGPEESTTNRQSSPKRTCDADSDSSRRRWGKCIGR